MPAHSGKSGWSGKGAEELGEVLGVGVKGVEAGGGPGGDGSWAGVGGGRVSDSPSFCSTSSFPKAEPRLLCFWLFNDLRVLFEAT